MVLFLLVLYGAVCIQSALVVQLYTPSVFMSTRCSCIVAVQHGPYKLSLSIEHINLSYKQTEIRALHP